MRSGAEGMRTDSVRAVVDLLAPNEKFGFQVTKEITTQFEQPCYLI